ncbi:hypothetical protein GGF41_008604, partial [Coemansia sp. RSA 2531]
MSMVALSKWVKVLDTLVPYIQDHISHDDHLMRLLVLPCVHALRMLLSQSADYFGHSAGRHSSIGQRLYNRLLPLFVVPALSVETGDMMSVGVLTTLLDAFDMFLSLSLRNVDKIPVETTVQRPSSRASESSVQSSVSFGGLGSIPVMKFVSSIFGPDTVDTVDTVGTDNVVERQTVDVTVGFDSVDFNLVSTLEVLREVWTAFDSSKPVAAEDQLLREFGI